MIKDNYQNKELVIAEIENRLQNWSIPAIKPKEIYKHSTFSFKTTEVI